MGVSVKRINQVGAGVLPVALLLLAAAALMLLFAQRHLLIDWRITQNGYAHRLAYTAAESGVAVVLSALNDPVQRAQILVDKKGTGHYDTLQKPEYAWSIKDSLAATVHIAAQGLSQADIRLRLQSTGCVIRCDPDNRHGQAVVSQIVALRGGIHRIPYALLTARGDLGATGNVTLNNQYAGARGMLLHAGRNVTVDSTVVRQTMPEMSPDAASIASDKGLMQMSAEQYFQYWMGSDKHFVQQSAQRIACGGECGGALAAAGSKVIWIDGNARISSGVIGSAKAPVILIASGTLEISGSANITGIVYSMAPHTRLALSQGRVDGAIIAEHDLSVENGGLYRYNVSALQAAQSYLGRFVPVPGTWSDGE